MKKIVIIFGATGNIGGMLLSHFANLPNKYLIITCGRTQIKGYKNYYWDMSSESPIPRISNDFPTIKSKLIIYAAIFWPKKKSDVDLNLNSLNLICQSLNDKIKFIYISSMVVRTDSATLYALIKKQEESVALKFKASILRLGVIDSKVPFGQMKLFIKFAKIFYFVPVPYPYASVVLSSEADVIKAIQTITTFRNKNIFEVVSFRRSFIDILRLIFIKNNLSGLCVPIPNFFCNCALWICNFLAPKSWIAMRLNGLKSFLS